MRVLTAGGRVSNQAAYSSGSTRARAPPFRTISVTDVQRKSLIAFLFMMSSISVFPLSGHSTAYPASCIASRIRATLSSVSRCAPAPTVASTDAQGLLWRMKATRFPAAGFCARSIHLLTRATNLSSRSSMGMCCSPPMPARFRLPAAPIGIMVIPPRNSGIATYHETLLPRIPSIQSLHSASVWW